MLMRPKSFVLGVIGLLSTMTAGCTYRAVATCSGECAIPEGVRKIRLEVENGTLDIAAIADTSDISKVTYKGGVRIDAGSQQELERLQQVPLELDAAVDEADATVLVIRAPRVPDGIVGMIAFEAGIHVPAALPIEVVVSNNGHVTAVSRRAFTKVRTRRGDLRFEDCHGGVEANTGQGVLIAFDHHGDLDVRTDLGDMQVFVREAGDKLTLSTGKGTVQCHVPHDLEFAVDARAEVGRIGSKFDFEVVKVGDYSAAMVGSRGSGATKVILRTASGHIQLIPRKFE